MQLQPLSLAPKQDSQSLLRTLKLESYRLMEVDWTDEELISKISNTPQGYHERKSHNFRQLENKAGQGPAPNLKSG